MAVSAPQGFTDGLSLADATRSSFWAIAWSMLDASRAGVATNMAYTNTLASCRSVEEFASLQANAVQNMLGAAEACALEMAEATAIGGRRQRASALPAGWITRKRSRVGRGGGSA